MESDYKNSEIRFLIDEFIHVQKYRDILKSRFIDGETFDALALHYDMSDRQIRRIVCKLQEQLFKHL